MLTAIGAIVQTPSAYFSPPKIAFVRYYVLFFYQHGENIFTVEFLHNFFKATPHRDCGADA